MATAVKTLRSLIAAGTSNGAGTTTTSTTWNLTTALGGLLTTKVTNGATGPTVAASVSVYTSGDGTNWKLFRTFVAQTSNNGVYEFPVVIPESTMYAQVQIGGNTGQAVTVEAFGQELTSIG